MTTLGQQLLRRKPTTPPDANEAHLKRSIGLVTLGALYVGFRIAQRSAPLRPAE